jgi:rubrerythrin
MSFEFNADEILEMAEQIERNGARFYRAGLKEMSSRTAGRERIEEIIKEEMGHIGFLNREIAALSSNVR